MKCGNEFILFTLSLSSLILTPGCKTEDTVSSSTYVIPGKYNYYGYDIDSNLFAYGAIDVVLTDSDITGTRNIQAVETINSQSGEVGIGNISGIMHIDNSFYVYLVSTRLPTVLIQGKFSPGLIKGTRIIDTGTRPEPSPSGYYTLQKQ